MYRRMNVIRYLQSKLEQNLKNNLALNQKRKEEKK